MRVSGPPGAARLAIGLAAAAALLIPASAASADPPGAPIGGTQLGPGLSVNLTAQVKGLPAGLTPKAWLVADLDSGQVLGAFNAHRENRPASTLKTLAALALIPKVDPNVEIPFTAEELAFTAQKDGKTTRVGLEVGKSYPAGRLFEAMLALSANDATEALAAAAPGGRDATLQAMNDIAATLQAHDTHAATPDGLDGPGQQTSAYDLALIARAALAVPRFTAYDTVQIVRLPSTTRPLGGSNHDRLQNSYKGVIGGKDGYTSSAGQVWWGAAARGGHRLVVVVVDAGFEPVSQEISLLDWGFAVDGRIAPVGELVGPVTAAGKAVTPVQVLQDPAATRVLPPARAAAAQTSGHSSRLWTWVLGLLILLAAAILGRRHLLAAPPRHRAAPGAPPGAPPEGGPERPSEEQTHDQTPRRHDGPSARPATERAPHRAPPAPDAAPFVTRTVVVRPDRLTTDARPEREPSRARQTPDPDLPPGLDEPHVDRIWRSGFGFATPPPVSTAPRTWTPSPEDPLRSGAVKIIPPAGPDAAESPAEVRLDPEAEEQVRR